MKNSVVTKEVSKYIAILDNLLIRDITKMSPIMTESHNRDDPKNHYSCTVVLLKTHNTATTNLSHY